MSKRGSKGGYTGGSTTVSAKDSSWFSRGSTRMPPEERYVSLPPLTPSEKAADEAFKKAMDESKYRLIKQGEQWPLKDRKKRNAKRPDSLFLEFPRNYEK